MSILNSRKIILSFAIFFSPLSSPPTLHFLFWWEKVWKQFRWFFFLYVRFHLSCFLSVLFLLSLFLSLSYCIPLYARTEIIFIKQNRKLFLPPSTSHKYLKGILRVEWMPIPVTVATTAPVPVLVANTISHLIPFSISISSRIY